MSSLSLILYLLCLTSLTFNMHRISCLLLCSALAGWFFQEGGTDTFWWPRYQIVFTHYEKQRRQSESFTLFSFTVFTPASFLRVDMGLSPPSVSLSFVQQTSPETLRLLTWGPGIRTKATSCPSCCRRPIAALFCLPHWLRKLNTWLGTNGVFRSHQEHLLCKGFYWGLNYRHFLREGIKWGFIICCIFLFFVIANCLEQ